MKRFTYTGCLLAVMTGAYGSAAFGQQACEQEIDQLQTQMQQQQAGDQVQREVEELLNAARNADDQECQQLVAQAREQWDAAQSQQSEQVARSESQQSQQSQEQQRQAQQAQQSEDEQGTEVEVEQPAPDVQVQQPSPEVEVEQPQPDVEVTQREPEVQVQQEEPEVNVEQAEPDVAVTEAEPEVSTRQSEEEPDVTVIQPDEQGQAREQQSEEQRQARSGSELSEAEATELVGNSLISQQGEEIGEISGVARSQRDDTLHALVDVGGFIGIGERTVAIPLEDAQISGEGDVMTSMSRQELEQMPEYQEEQYAVIEEQEQLL